MSALFIRRVRSAGHLRGQPDEHVRLRLDCRLRPLFQKGRGGTDNDNGKNNGHNECKSITVSLVLPIEPPEGLTICFF